jgi:hypothetical protein
MLHWIVQQTAPFEAHEEEFFGTHLCFCKRWMARNTDQKYQYQITCLVVFHLHGILGINIPG